MNPLTNVKNITKLNDLELARGTVDKKSWHDMYKDSAWIFIGGLSYGLTEGDVLSVFSQYGEIVNINLVRDAKTGKIKGFCFLCYANQKSTILAVDNLNGIKLCGRTIRVDHVSNYKPPKERENEDELTKQLKNEGCAPKPIKMEKDSDSEIEVLPKQKKSKKAKKEKKKHKKKRKHENSKESKEHDIKVKEEKIDPGYTKNELSAREISSTKKQKSMASSDSESSSSESENSDSSDRRPKTKQTKQYYQEKYDGPSTSTSRFHTNEDEYKRNGIAYKERNASNREIFKESDKHKRSREGYLDEVSSRSQFYETSDRDRRYSGDERSNDRFETHKKKNSTESSLGHRKRQRSTSSERDSLDKQKVSVHEKGNEKHRKNHHGYDAERSKSDRRYESSPHYRDYKDGDRKSRHKR